MKKVSILSLHLGYGGIEKCVATLANILCTRYEVEIAEIRNDFFGEHVTVSGLLTAQDVIAQLKGKDLGNIVAIPCNMLRMGERVFLDDVTIEEMENALQSRILIVKSSGLALLEAMFGFDLEDDQVED